ncbi:phage tail tape measure protein [Aurantimonas sp. A2-1-M11]|uniref:phage tail tape measure protein n=1 Tax=Aurantimonas sp. A2-1-M11 TaxID=3113712 RepID=UPI002F94ED93
MAGSAVIGALRVNLGIDSATFNKGLKQAETGIQKFGRMAKVGLLAVGAAGATAATAMAYSVKTTIDAADDMSKAASKIGVPIEELSRLKYAADLSGLSFEQLQTSVGRLSRMMNDAKNGTKEAVDSFAQLGISATNADGSLKSASQVMGEISDKFATMPDGAEKTALAMELMGRSGTNMIPMLNGGSAALQDLMNEADNFGQVFTEGMGKSAEVFNDNISRLTGVMGNLSAKIATDVLPYLVQFTNWMVENAPQIRAFAQSTITAFSNIGTGIMSVKTTLNEFGAGVRAVWAEFEASWNSVIEVRNRFVASMVAMKDESIAAVQQMVSEIRQLAGEIIGAFQAIPEQMAQVGRDIMAGLKNGITEGFGAVKASVGSMGKSIRYIFGDPLGIDSPSKVMHEMGGYVMEGLNNGLTSMAGTTESIVSAISSSVSGAFKGLIDGSKTVKEALSEVLASLADMLMNSAFQSIFGGGGGLGGGGGGLLGGLFSGLGSLLGFANGGKFQVGGAGGIDSQLVAFRASPNETVSITKPGQDAGGGGGQFQVQVTPSPYFDVQVQKISDNVASRRVQQGQAQAAKQFPQLQQDRQRRTG